MSERDGIYLNKELKRQIKATARAERRSIVNLLRDMYTLWQSTTPVERAQVLQAKGAQDESH